MPNSNTYTSQLFRGMVESHPMLFKDGNYDFGLNVEIEGFDGNGLPILQNVPSNKKCLNFPSGFKVVNYANVVEQNRIVWFLYNPDTEKSEIGETLNHDCKESSEDNFFSGNCDNCESIRNVESKSLEKIIQTPCCTYTKLSGSDCLNFSVKFPITSVQYFIDTCSLKIFFADEKNPFRYIEFEYEDANDQNKLIVKDKFFVITGYSDDDCKVPIYSDELDCNKLAVFGNKQIPTIDFIDLVGGGSNAAGVYQFLVGFADVKSNKLSSYFSSTNPIPVFSKYVTIETDYKTDRAIALDINGLNPIGAYSYYNLVVAKTINNITSFYLVGTFPISQTHYVYTGNNSINEKKLTPEDIFQSYPFYNTVNQVTLSNDILYLTGLTENKKLNLQRVANKIKLYWQTIAIPESVYRNPRNVNKFRSAMRDEVVPYGVEFVFTNGEESSAFHIPGREATEDDLEIITNTDVIRENNCEECESVSFDAQVVIDELNTDAPTPTPSTPPGTSNAEVGEGCSEEEFSQDSCETFDSGTGTVPVIDAGSDATIDYYGIAPLNGAIVSNDAAIVSIEWKEISGPNEALISSTASPLSSFSKYVVGTYVFQLCVTDADGNVGQDSVEILVTIPANLPPTADPGLDKIIVLPEDTSYLNASASSDSDGEVITYLWEQTDGPTVALIANPNAFYTEVNFPTPDEGDYEFTLTVTDDRGCIAIATTIITISPDPFTVPPECVDLLYPVNGSIVSSKDSVVFQWRSASNATEYDIYIYKPDDGFVLGVPTATIDTNFYTATGLEANTIYNWFVIPKNDAGDADGCEDFYRAFVTPTENVYENCDKVRWQVYNTATLIGGDLETYNECEETCYQYGEFAYWESIRTYPLNQEVWGDLCGKPIRHHKYPDSLISHIHDNENGDPDFFKNNIVYPIGVKVDHDSVRQAIADAVADELITQADADRIIGYKIVRGNRVGHKSVIAKGILFDVNNYRKKKDGDFVDDRETYFSNFPYNDVRDNQLITDDLDNYERHDDPEGADLPFIFSNRYTFHSPDTHFNEPEVPSGTELKLETVEYGQSEGYYTVANKQAKQKFLSDASYALAFTGGILAALLRTQDQRETKRNIRGVDTSLLGVAAGTYGPTPVPPIGTHYKDFPFATGTEIPALPPISTIEKRTVQGKRSDWINPLVLATRQPELLPLLPIMVLNYISDFIRIILEEINLIVGVIEKLTKYRDWSLQYNSVGRYTGYTPVENDGGKRRVIDSSAYLKPDNEIINETSQTDPTNFSFIQYNNLNRESSLYLRYFGTPLENAGVVASVEDKSRFKLSTEECTLDKKMYKDISSYYASIKTFVPDQYGSIFDIEYLPTDSFIFDITTENTTCKTVFGGDTFITRFGLKTKIPYFLATTFMLPEGTDFNYTLYPNVGVPRYYFDSNIGIGSNIDNIFDIFSLFDPTELATTLGRPKSYRDCKTDKFFYQNGYIYLYHYGVPYFLVESDINTDMRYAENSKEKDFYPHQQSLNFWFQEENVPITEDNSYLYNTTYSKQNKEAVSVIDPVDFIPSKQCIPNHTNRTIYAEDQNWLVYKGDNFYETPLSKGRVVSVEGIENKTVWIRTNKGSQFFKSFIQIPTSGQNAQIGSGGIFTNPPQDFAETTLGFIGSQHRAVLHTEFGHITPDAKRGQIFNIGRDGSGFEEISLSKRNWFRENLPFHLLRDFKNMPEQHIDNNANGVGIVMSYDRRNNRMFLTKLDYKCINTNVKYDELSKEFYIISDDEQINVKLEDSKYFKNCSWTVSYRFDWKAWVSVHSFLPNHYLDFVDRFMIIQDDAAWMHNVTIGSYQVYCGKLHPFIVEPIFKFEGPLKVLNSLEFDSEVRRQQNEFDFINIPNVPGFNKAIVYNNNYNSGILNLTKVDKKGLKNIGKYPIRNFDSWDVEVSAADYKWRFNQFYNLLRDDSSISQWSFNGNNIEKDLNQKAFNYKKLDSKLFCLKGQWFKMRLINDKYSNYRILFKFGLSNQTQLKK